MGGRSNFKFYVILIILLMVQVPTSQPSKPPSVVETYHESHISDLMPSTNMTLHLQDKDGRSVLQTKSDFKFTTAWHNGEEETGLMFGLDKQSFGSGVSRIDFETVTFHWWAYSYTGEAIFDTKRNQSFYLSSTAVGWSHEGAHLTTHDVTIVAYIGASMEWRNFTIHSFYNTIVCDSESLIIGVNFTRHEQGWSSSTFSNISSEFTPDVTSVSYVMSESLQTPIWYDALPYAIGIGVVVFMIGILRFIVIEERRLNPG